MMIRATVLHSVGPGMLWEYDPSKSKLYFAHAFQLVVPDDAKPERIAEWVWMLGNVGDASELPGDSTRYIFANQVTEYRRRLNRSISMGDVVLLENIDEEVAQPLAALYAVTIGWRRLEGFPPYSREGDTPEMSAAFVAHGRFKQAVDRGEASLQ